MQPPFVGPSYDLESRPASVQRTVNLVPVMLEPGNERAGWAFEDVPGFVVFSTGPEEPPAPEIILVSNPYPVMFIDYADVTHAALGGDMFTWLPGEVDITHAVVGGSLSSVLITYDDWPPEGVDLAHALTAGVLTDVLLTYEIDVEDVDVTHAFIGGELALVVLLYSNWPVEKVDVTHALTGGTLS